MAKKREIRSMHDYIRDNYQSEMIETLSKKIEDGWNPLYASRAPRFDFPYDIIPQRDTGRITSISLHRMAEEDINADIVICMNVDIVKQHDSLSVIESRNCYFRADMWITLGKEINIEYGHFRKYHQNDAFTGQLLNEYLIPYLKNEDIEVQAESLLAEYTPEYLDYAHPKGEMMAKRMGLKVVFLCLYNKPRTDSILFFDSGTVTVAISDIETEVAYIRPKTIVINTRGNDALKYDIAIFHECFHYAVHNLFFKFQKLSSSSNQKMPKWAPREDQEIRDNPISWMEHQAQRGSLAMLLPRTMVMPRLQEMLVSMRGNGEHSGQKFEKIGLALAKEFDVERTRIRGRFISLGYIEAKGSLNYINDKYIRPYAFDRESCAGSQTFSIETHDLINEYLDNPAFRAIIDKGDYVYVDGLMCIDDPRYVIHYPNSCIMTPWAISHVDECCLRFTVHYVLDDEYRYQIGQLNSDEKYNGKYVTLSLENCTHEQIRERARVIASVLHDLPASFSGTLTAHMQRLNVTIEELAERACLSESTVKRLRKTERSVYSPDQVMAICIALHLPPEYSSDLVEKAGLNFNKTEQGLMYNLILRTMYNMRVNDIQILLQQANFMPLALKGSEMIDMEEFSVS